jgi:hypothetical protein
MLDEKRQAIDEYAMWPFSLIISVLFFIKTSLHHVRETRGNDDKIRHLLMVNEYVCVCVPLTYTHIRSLSLSLFL